MGGRLGVGGLLTVEQARNLCVWKHCTWQRCDRTVFLFEREAMGGSKLVPVLRALDDGFYLDSHPSFGLLVPILIIDQHATASSIHAVSQDSEAAICDSGWLSFRILVRERRCWQERQTDPPAPRTARVRRAAAEGAARTPLPILLVSASARNGTKRRLEALRALCCESPSTLRPLRRATAARALPAPGGQRPLCRLLPRSSRRPSSRAVAQPPPLSMHRCGGWRCDHRSDLDFVFCV